MNLRYRIITTDNKLYILDMGKSFWKILFPFLFWIFPSAIYKVNNVEIALGEKCARVLHSLVYDTDIDSMKEGDIGKLYDHVEIEINIIGHINPQRNLYGVKREYQDEIFWGGGE